MTETLISVSLIFIVSFVVVIAGIKRLPLGELAALLLVGILTWWRTGSFAHLGLVAPANWLQTILFGLAVGSVLALASSIVIEPFAEGITGEAHDFSAYSNLRGNFKLLLTWLPIVWTWVAFIEEIIFRGFILNELIRIVGNGITGLFVSLLLSSFVFGLAHWYQGKSGLISTSIVGLLLGCIFVWSKFNLWLPILAHGFTDTVGLGLIYANADTALKEQWTILRKHR